MARADAALRITERHMIDAVLLAERRSWGIGIEFTLGPASPGQPPYTWVLLVKLGPLSVILLAR